ncbi:MAG TPA: signal peptidase I, partial [Thermomicrobiales bacterium]|nr:signal peptidase I [Thermomicrobiales bacterium]
MSQERGEPEHTTSSPSEPAAPPEHSQQPLPAVPAGTTISTADRPPGDAADDDGDRRTRTIAFVREVAETVLLTLVIFVAVRTLVVNFRVDGESMEPNLLNGEYLLVNKAVYFHFDLNAVKNLVPGQHHSGQDIVYLFHPPQRGDIIVFEPPVPTDKPYVKRVIGLPGDRITIREGTVYVNGQALKEPYISDPPRYTYPLSYGGATEYTVPAGAIFVLGDNRNNSNDSHVFNAVQLASVIGKAT